MKSIFSKCIFSTLILLSFYSCDRTSCETDNPIFLNNEVLSKVYQTEVVNKIKSIGTDNLRFWLADYLEKDQNDYLVFYVQNKNLCAEVVMHIDQTNPAFSQLVETKGKGRFNAEFRGVTFDISKNDDDKFPLHYTGHERIID
ncbi:hypothetical protein [Psychroserpens sp. Hel_I_66]|uniref:hypothetical protein n=1 Tax=Psychroserpens sp. Hel_I_66 TaxID=1250004 RepID=UPI000648DA0C|nr:hypothetical protein [Psychroserpens sp. Hel_I_66]